MTPHDALTIITPTIGRASLRDTLRSYAHQMLPGDEYLVMGDTHDGPLPLAAEIVGEFDARFRYVPVRSTYCSFGHLEINAGLDLARGRWLVCNDDDDIATPTALADIRASIAGLTEPRPLLFRFMSVNRELVWGREPLFAESFIGGHCAVFPNLPGRVGRFTGRYSGDWDYLRSTIERWPNGLQDALWVDRCIAFARPTKAELGRLIPAGAAV